MRNIVSEHDYVLFHSMWMGKDNGTEFDKTQQISINPVAKKINKNKITKIDLFEENAYEHGYALSFCMFWEEKLDWIGKTEWGWDLKFDKSLSFCQSQILIKIHCLRETKCCCVSSLCCGRFG